MPTSLYSKDFQDVLNAATAVDPQRAARRAYPSPTEWRDHLIYFLMVDRFNNPLHPPRDPRFDDPNYFHYQGGTFSGIKAQLRYIKNLGATAIWLSPVLKNAHFDQGSYHGYGIQDFLSANPFFADDPNNADQELRDLVDAAHHEDLYVIFDIVLNHTADVFAYMSNLAGSDVPYSDSRLPIEGREGGGRPEAQLIDLKETPRFGPDAGVWPIELQNNEYFRRQGDPAPYDDTVGDFPPFKQLSTWEPEVQRILIRAYQYVIARFDVDGFRIDTLRYLKGDLAKLFGNSMREFALSIGKKNFFTFGEVLDATPEQDIARFIGRNTNKDGELLGIDAALDYPLRNALVPMLKGFVAPQQLVGMYQTRKEVEKNIVTSHGDATRYFVTFLDNHDLKERIRFVPVTGTPNYDNQVTAGIACLMALPGIPCLYYGTEQGLHGAGSDPAVREALWGGPGFNQSSTFYKEIRKIAGVRATQAAMRYGRFYFRPISGDQRTFGISADAPGMLAFSRILNDQEVLTAVNFDTQRSQVASVIVDSNLSRAGDDFNILYSNNPTPRTPAAIKQLAAGSVVVREPEGWVGKGPVNVLTVTLQPMEVQILRKK